MCGPRSVGSHGPNDNSFMLTLLIENPSVGDVKRLKPFVAQAAGAAGLAESEAKQLRLAVEEAVANVVGYGGASAIALAAEAERGRVVLTIDDDGLPFDPTGASPTDLSVAADQRPVGGLGIVLMRELTDSLSYRRSGGTTF